MQTIEHDSLDGFLIRWHEREKHVRETGFVRPTPELCKWIGAWGPWVEIGAGSGALAKGINEHGGRCVATDTFGWHDLQGHNIEKLGWSRQGIVRARGERVGRLVSRYPSVGLLTSWPEYGESWAYEAASHLAEGQLLCYIGEGHGGCTADDQFHELLERDFEEMDSYWVKRWEGINDHCWVYARRRIPLTLTSD